MTHVDGGIHIADPDFYLDDPHPTLARLRAESSTYFDPALNTFLVTRYEDVSAISRSPQVWSSAAGVLLNDAKYESNVGNSFFPERAERLMTTDPPRHRELRRVIAPSFTPRAVNVLEGPIREYCRVLVGSLPADDPFDFIENVAMPMPLWAVARLLGLKADNVADLRYWSDELMKMGGDFTREQLSQTVENLRPMQVYLGERLDARRDEVARGEIGDDLLCTLVRAEIENENLSDANVLGLSVTTLVAGNETTRNLLGWIMVCLADHPDQLAQVRDDPSLIGAAVDETLRWASPVLGFLRTAVTEIELAGHAVAAGQHAYLLYLSANRDAAVFDHPDAFDINRSAQRPHLAFGYGEHVCPGASLARLEARILLEELFARFPRWELDEGATRIRSVLQNGWQTLPVRLRLHR